MIGHGLGLLSELIEPREAGHGYEVKPGLIDAAVTALHGSTGPAACLFAAGPDILSFDAHSCLKEFFRGTRPLGFAIDWDGIAASRVWKVIQCSSMEPMFLPGVEANPQPSPWTRAIESLKQSGSGEYPQIWHLFAFKPEATEHLARFTQAILRAEAPLTPGFRELIAAYTSRRNHCPF